MLLSGFLHRISALFTLSATRAKSKHCAVYFSAFSLKIRTLNHSSPLRRQEKRRINMFLQYYLDENGDRVYTLKKVAPDGQPTSSAHPARFSPDDKFSRHRVTLKKRFGLLLTQQPKPVM